MTATAITTTDTTDTTPSEPKRRRPEVVYPKTRATWVLGLALSLFHRLVDYRGKEVTAPPIEFGENATWKDVHGIGYERLKGLRGTKGEEKVQPREQYESSVRLTRDAADGMWRKRLAPGVISRLGWKEEKGASKLGQAVLIELFNRPRHEIMREIWGWMSPAEQALYPNLLMKVDEPDPRGLVWKEEAKVEEEAKAPDSKKEPKQEAQPAPRATQESESDTAWTVKVGKNVRIVIHRDSQINISPVDAEGYYTITIERP